jgi:hypothetical protein
MIFKSRLYLSGSLMVGINSLTVKQIYTVKIYFKQFMQKETPF